MKAEEILQHTAHRPWEIPDTKWKLYQEWHNVIFLHWKVDFLALRKVVPEELEIDTFEGTPWISLTAFTTKEIQPRGLPSFTPLPDFDEINIRTYIKSGKRTGVYFLSLEASKLVSAELTKLVTELPYTYSEMSRGLGSFSAANTNYESSFEIRYEMGEKDKSKDELDEWLMERYALFQDGREHIIVFEVLHKPWPLMGIKINHLQVEYPPFSKFLNLHPDKTGYSPGVEVLIWGKEKWKGTMV